MKCKECGFDKKIEIKLAREEAVDNVSKCLANGEIADVISKKILDETALRIEKEVEARVREEENLRMACVCADSLKEAKARVAKEIFEELENTPLFKKEYNYIFNAECNYKLLKKRFLESESAGRCSSPENLSMREANSASKESKKTSHKSGKAK